MPIDRKTALTVQMIDPETAITFIRTCHYSKVLPRLNRHYLGFYESGRLSGVVLLSWGTQPLQTIKKIFQAHDLTTVSYVEIGKMCFLPEKNIPGISAALRSLHSYVGYGTTRAAFSFTHWQTALWGNASMCTKRQISAT